MNTEDQLLIGGLLMAIAIFSATHAHARPLPVPVSHIARIVPAPTPAAE